MTNRRVVEMADTNKNSCKVVLRREGENEFFAVLGWTPEFQRARGRPKTT